MKNVLSALAFILFVSFNYSTTAQKVIDQGTVTMEITDVASDDPQMEMGLAGLKGGQTVLSFKEGIYATGSAMMGGMIKVTTLINQKEDKMDLLMDAMGQKIWVETGLDESQSAQDKEIAKMTKVSYDKSDTKKIMGYDCYKVTIENPEMEDMNIFGYATDQIKTNANLIQGMQSVTIDGYLMEYTVATPQFSMTTTAVDIKDTVDESKFELNTKGYKKMTMEEFQNQMGGMGGF